jgi:hypothetical protein
MHQTKIVLMTLTISSIYLASLQTSGGNILEEITALSGKTEQENRK